MTNFSPALTSDVTMTRAPEQSIVDQLEAAGYQSDTIIAYLEARVEREWQQYDFADAPACPEGQKMIFGICRNVGEDEKDSEGKPTGKKKEAKLTPEEEKVMKAAKAQGSEPTPGKNKKVVVDGKEYGWAIKGGKPMLVEWGTVAGIKDKSGKITVKAGDGSGKTTVKEPEKKEEKPANRQAIQGQLKGLRKALEKQVNDAGRQAILKQIDKLMGSL